MSEPNRPPVIGITTYSRDEEGDFCLPAAYVDAVRAAGGVPVLLPPGEPDPARVLVLVGGLVFTGGGDIDPALYGGPPHPTVYLVDPERDAFELALARQALQTGAPVLGICRGLEVLSVASGGELIPHLPDVFGNQVPHRAGELAPSEHPVRVLADSRLARIMGAVELAVKSWHHQATRSVPPGWRAVAFAPDGVIEAMEHNSLPWVIAVQWHPELSLDDPRQQRLFEAFVAAAQAIGATGKQALGAQGPVSLGRTGGR